MSGGWCTQSRAYSAPSVHVINLGLKDSLCFVQNITHDWPCDGPGAICVSASYRAKTRQQCHSRIWTMKRIDDTNAKNRQHQCKESIAPMKRIDGTNERIDCTNAKSWQHQWKELRLHQRKELTEPMKRIDSTNEKNRRHKLKESTAPIKRIDCTNETSWLHQWKKLTTPTKNETNRRHQRKKGLHGLHHEN